MKKKLFILYLVTFYGFFIHANHLENRLDRLFRAKKYSLVLELALNEYNNARTEKDKPMLLFYIGKSYLSLDKKEEAIEYFDKLKLKYPKSEFKGKALWELIKIFKGNPVKEEAYCQEIINNFPKSNNIVLVEKKLLELLLKNKNYSRAIGVFNKISLLNPNQDLQIKFYAAVAYRGNRDYIDAVEIIRDIEKLNKNFIQQNAYRLYIAGEIFYQNANYDEALKTFKELVFHFNKSEYYFEASHFIAKILKLKGKNLEGALILAKSLKKMHYLKKNTQKEYYSMLVTQCELLINLKKDELMEVKKKYTQFYNVPRILKHVRAESHYFKSKRAAALLLSEFYRQNLNFEEELKSYEEFLEKKVDSIIIKKFKNNLNGYIKLLYKNKKYKKITELWLKYKNKKSYLDGDNLLIIASILSSFKLHENALYIYNHLGQFQIYKKYHKDARSKLIEENFNAGEYQKLLELLSKYDQKNTNFNYNQYLYYKLESLKRADKKEEYNKVIDKYKPDKIKSFFDAHNCLLKAIYLFHKQDLVQSLKISEILSEEKNRKFLSEMDIQRNKTLKGDIFFYSKKYDKSLEAYSQIKGKGVNKEWSLFQSANIYKKLKKDKEAKGKIQELKKLNPKSYWLKQWDFFNE